MNYKQMLDKLVELEARIRVLEQEQKKSLDFFRNVPIPQPVSVPVPFIPETHPWKKREIVYNWKECSVCGSKDAMGYVCPRADCPTAVTCQTNPQDGFQ